VTHTSAFVAAGFHATTASFASATAMISHTRDAENHRASHNDAHDDDDNATGKNEPSAEIIFLDIGEIEKSNGKSSKFCKS
jgi:hypothetical protein